MSDAGDAPGALVTAFHVVFAAAAGIAGLAGAIVFEHAFSDSSVGPTAATFTDAANLLLGAASGVSLVAFAFMLVRPAPTAFGLSAACVAAGYLLIAVPVFAMAGADAVDGLMIAVLEAPLVALCGAVAGFLAFVARALVWRQRAS